MYQGGPYGRVQHNAKPPARDGQAIVCWVPGRNYEIGAVTRPTCINAKLASVTPVLCCVVARGISTGSGVVQKPLRRFIATWRLSSMPCGRSRVPKPPHRL